MNFAGWVPIRRGIIAHLQEGELSNQEFAVLIVLILLADKSTGAGTINSPCLRSFVPRLTHDAAKRVLPKLQQKGYIFREIKHRSKAAYRYWVNRYEVTDGPNKKRQVDLSKVLRTKDVADIRYVVPAPDDAPETAPEGAPDPAPHYNNREVRSDNRESYKAIVVSEVCASANNTQAVGTPILKQSGNGSTGLCASVSAPPERKPPVPISEISTLSTSGVSDVLTVDPSSVSEQEAYSVGAITGPDGVFINRLTGSPLPASEVMRRVTYNRARLARNKRR